MSFHCLLKVVYISRDKLMFRSTAYKVHFSAFALEEFCYGKHLVKERTFSRFRDFQPKNSNKWDEACLDESGFPYFALNLPQQVG